MRSVMLVEKEKRILTELKNIIDWEALGFLVVSTAQTGAEALELLKRDSVDIIVAEAEMPVMSGLQLLAQVRRTDPRTRVVIMGEGRAFPDMKKALRMDAEDWISRPADREELLQALRSCRKHLEQMEKREAAVIDENVMWQQFLAGDMDMQLFRKYLRENNIGQDVSMFCAAILKIEPSAFISHKMTDMLQFAVFQEVEGAKKVISRYLWDTYFMVVLGLEEKTDSAEEWFVHLQNRLESEWGVRSFLAVSNVFYEMGELPEVYRTLRQMQRAFLTKGYGSHITEAEQKGRSDVNVIVDSEKLFDFCVKKDVKAARTYIEELFAEYVQEGSVDALYQIVVKTVLNLQRIQKEYNLEGRGIQLPEIIDRMEHIRDLAFIREGLISEITDTITWMKADRAPYTPVVRQLISEVKNGYQGDMNLKTLAGKYHMNPSYLGQIFQREVGCSFSQYLNSIRTSAAKNLLLTTDMRINDIAKLTGFSDTSYFYRKFKQSYGVSPAAIREMKNY